MAASHSRTVLSSLPEAMRVPSGLNATLYTALGVAGQRLADGLAGGRVPQPHRLVVAAGGDARAVGAERHAGHRVRVAGQRLRRSGWPVAASHSRTVLSALPEASRVPSGLNATLYTVLGVAGQRLADGLAGGRVPQPHRVVGAAGGEPGAVGAERHAGHRARCGRSAAGRSGWPVAASHSRTVLSSLPEAMRVPSGLNATLDTASVWPVSGWPIGLAGGRVPQPHRLVVTAGGDARAVGAERHAGHWRRRLGDLDEC